MFTEKSTFADLALFLAEHNLRCTRLTAPRADAPAVCILVHVIGDGTAWGSCPSVQGTGTTLADAVNDAARILGVIL